MPLRPFDGEVEVGRPVMNIDERDELLDDVVPTAPFRAMWRGTGGGGPPSRVANDT